MQIQGIYAALATANMGPSEAFYSSLFGRAPDDRPVKGLVQWRNVAGANVQIFLSKENAGSSLCTIVVPDMEKAREDLENAGVTLEDERSGHFGRIAHIRDPDGNLITLAEPPGNNPD